MRVAALYDVHRNLPALEAVLADVDREQVDAIVCGGDLVWGPFPAECLARVVEREALFLMGNADREVVNGGNERDVWCQERLSATEIDEVGGWPVDLGLEIEALGRVLFCHGSPRREDEILTEETPEDAVREILSGVDTDLVVCGHTHHQFDRTVAGSHVVNPGSVGLPYEGRPGAFWALLGPAVEHRRIKYDVDAALGALGTTGFPGVDELFGPSLLDPMPKQEAVAVLESRRGP